MTLVILIVEDDPVLRRTLGSALRVQGFRVHLVPDAQGALAAVDASRYDVLLLDLGLPGLGGLTALPLLRARHNGPIIVVSARRDQGVKVQALDAGADDYLTKPFGLPELVARIRAQARRAGLDSLVRAGPLTIDMRREEVTGPRGPIALTATEWAVLTVLAGAQGRPVSTEELLKAVWPDQTLEHQANVRSYINLLRRKLEPQPGSPSLLLHEHGRGYRLVVDSTVAP
jgi:two-component system, OmpR family, KDP operon response regulator KdpE